MSDSTLSLLISAPEGIQRSILVQMVEAAGVKDIRIASNASQTRDMLDAKLPDVMLIDWSLQHGDCEEVLRCVRGDSRNDRRFMPIVALNANRYGHGRQVDVGFGVQASLETPHSAQDLMVAIARAIGDVADTPRSEAMLPWVSQSAALRARLH